MASSCKVVRAVVYTSQQLNALQLQFCLVSSSHSNVGQFSFECCPVPQKSAQESNTCPALGGWPMAPPPALSLYAFPDLCWMLAAPLTGWLVTLLPLSLALDHWEFSTESLALCLTPILQGRFSIPAPLPLSVLDYSLLLMFFTFAGQGQFSMPRGFAKSFSQKVSRGVVCGAWCTPVPLQFQQLWNQLAGRNGWLLSVWHGTERVSKD
jgi:hypothetical protein